MLFRSPAIKWQAVSLGVLMILSAVTEGIGLVMLVPLLEAVGSGGTSGTLLPTPFADFDYALSLGSMLALFVGLIAIRSLLVVARTSSAIRFESTLANGLRLRAWQAMLHCDWRELSGMRRSESASLLISSLDRVGYGLSQLIAAISALVTLGMLSLAGFLIAPQVVAVLVGLGIAVLAAYHRLRRRAARQGEALIRSQATVYASLSEGMAALRAVKAHKAESQAYRILESGLARLAEGHRAFVRDKALGTFALHVGGALTLSVLAWLAVTKWGLGLALFLPLIALFVRALPLLATVQEAWQSWAHARPALVEAEQLIARLEACREPADESGEILRFAATLTLANLNVRFAGQDVAAVDDVSLTIPRGSITAIVGPSGAGKSTLADVLAGLLAPDSGELLLDGIALDPARRRAWRGAVAYVEQDPVLLTASVRGNLMWAAPAATEAQLWQALDDAQAADFVRALPAGLDTLLGDGGRRLSGGERQRLMLARALLRDPQLLILDEATSALDAANEAAIVAALRRLRGQITMLLICHRGSLLELADQVVRLDAGRLVDET